MMLSSAVIEAITENNINIVFCNSKHMPHSTIMSLSGHYHPYSVLKSQMSMTQDFKDKIWAIVIKYKILNQALVTKFNLGDMSVYNRLNEFAHQVKNGDLGNREGIASKMFFKNLYGAEFIRREDDAINSALNYGYSIIRSAISRTLCAYGYVTTLGIHHINESNAFNLADDLMEPFRPLVDMWVDANHLDLYAELNSFQKRELANLLNSNMKIEKKVMKVRYVIDLYVKSFSSAIKNNKEEMLLFPEIIQKSLCEVGSDD